LIIGHWDLVIEFLMQWLGLDIGGAQIKMADGRGFAHSVPFAMWKQSERLEQELRTSIAHGPQCDHLAVTMTGELADCFRSKTEGVHFILEALRQAADGRHTRVYLSNGILVTPQVAMTRPLEVAAANWHVLARFAARFVQNEVALVIDIGSTTCDIVPLAHGELAAQGKTDTQRLLHGELVYCGVERTPVCSLVESVPYRGQKCPIARELFATTRDVYMLLGELAEDVASRTTADGRLATKAAARDRMSRMISADESIFNHKDAVMMARAIADAQSLIISRGVTRVIGEMPSPPTAVVLVGEGEFLARRLFQRLQWKPRVVSLTQEIGLLPSRCGPAHALAVLAREAVGAT
jgi:probable H4MPT-linked C1 transfer pathway protein